MGRIFRFFLMIGCFFCLDAMAATALHPSSYVDRQSYAYMYPYLSNEMRTKLNPGATVSQTNNPIDIIVKTKRMSPPRRVVPRTAKTTKTNTGSGNTTTSKTRRVVPRTSVARTATRGVVARSAARVTRDDSSVKTAAQTTNITNEGVSSSRCLADYTECMNRYCKRENMAYNRCYCSSKLAQIDATYKNPINNLIIKIIKIRSNNQWTEEEMNEYWMDRIGQYVGENSWEKLDEALNIEWPTTDERIRGQNAFLTGHEYCVQHLKNCAYMASNLRDAYRSKISRDCDTYEKSLIKIKNVAESVIEHYSE